MSYEADKDLVASTKAALSLAKKYGASDASASATREREITTSWRDGKIEKVSDATSRSVSLGLYVDGKYGSVSTSDLRPQALETFVESSIALVRSLAKDPHRKLPDPKYYGSVRDDLEIFFGSWTDPAERIQRLKAIEAAARSVPGADKITSVSAETGDSSFEVYRATTNGFEGGYAKNTVWMDASTTVKDDDGRRPEDYASAVVCGVPSLPSSDSVGKDATKRALERLGAKKIGSGTMPMLVENRAAQSLLRHIIGPLSGSALQQKSSFFENQLGKPVASKALSLADNPTLLRGLASAPFDGEGMDARRREIITDGVLKTYFLDVYYANKLKMEPTTGRPSNLQVYQGKKSLKEMMKDMKDGILVTSFLGGNSNSTTGVFSLGLSGFHIVNGERKEPISEMNLSGNHVDFWKRLVAVGNDPYMFSSIQSPSLMFDGASIAGK